MDKYLFRQMPRGYAGGWYAPIDEPVLGGLYGTCFDVEVAKEDDTYRMWFSWRPTRLIGHTTSKDGIHWEMPSVVLASVPGSDWEGYEVNRPTLVKRNGLYHMWYTGQTVSSEFTKASSSIGYATSVDGLNWERHPEPVMRPEYPWEKYALMCPFVLWDEENSIYRMWYSGGEQYEPDAIGYATSKDGIHWDRLENPIFVPRADSYWQCKKVTAPFVLEVDGGYVMYYIGFDGSGHSAVGAVCSEDGISGWTEHPDNPLIAGKDGSWDHNGICKVSIIEEESGGCKLWYNGCNRQREEIGILLKDEYHTMWGVEGAPVVEKQREPIEYQGPVEKKMWL